MAADDIDIEIPKDLRQQLSCYINPLQESVIRFGLDSLNTSVKNTDTQFNPLKWGIILFDCHVMYSQN